MSSSFGTKVESFLGSVGTDLSDAEKDVVAWFQHIFNKHKAGQTPAAPGNQAGNGSVPPLHPILNPLPPTPLPVNPAPTPAPGTQAGSGALTPTPAPTTTTTTTTAAVTMDTADSNGLAAFIGLQPGNKYASQRVNIAEVVNALPFGSQGREIGLQNLRIANDKFNIQDAEFIGVAYPAVQVKNQGTGEMEWVINDESKSIPNTTSFPAAKYTYNGVSYDLGTTAGVIAMVLVAGMVPDHIVNPDGSVGVKTP